MFVSTENGLSKNSNQIGTIIPARSVTTLTRSEQFFDNIVGYSDIKKLFNMSFSSDKPVHILLVGPPASAKTLFMLECMKLERSFFTLGSHSYQVRNDRLFVRQTS